MCRDLLSRLAAHPPRQGQGRPGARGTNTGTATPGTGRGTPGQPHRGLPGVSAPPGTPAPGPAWGSRDTHTGTRPGDTRTGAPTPRSLPGTPTPGPGLGLSAPSRALTQGALPGGHPHRGPRDTHTGTPTLGAPGHPHRGPAPLLSQPGLLQGRLSSARLGSPPALPRVFLRGSLPLPPSPPSMPSSPG